MIKKATRSNREDQILKGVVSLLRREIDPSSIILFGSRGKGKQESRSDFDFAVPGKRPPSKQERELKEEIEKIAGLYKVDLVFLDEVEGGFREIILSTGKKVYEKRN